MPEKKTYDNSKKFPNYDKPQNSPKNLYIETEFKFFLLIYRLDQKSSNTVCVYVCVRESECVCLFVRICN